MFQEIKWLQQSSSQIRTLGAELSYVSQCEVLKCVQAVSVQAVSECFSGQSPQLPRYKQKMLLRL